MPLAFSYIAESEAGGRGKTLVEVDAVVTVCSCE